MRHLFVRPSQMGIHPLLTAAESSQHYQCHSPKRSTQSGEGSPGESSSLFSSLRVKKQHGAYKGIITLLAFGTSQVSQAAKDVGIAAVFEAKIRQTHDFGNCM